VKAGLNKVTETIKGTMQDVDEGKKGGSKGMKEMKGMERKGKGKEGG
jgi:hypothetical protein